jgi:6-phosphogluconolactonase
MEEPREEQRLKGGERDGAPAAGRPRGGADCRGAAAPAPRGEVRIFAGTAELMRAAAEEVIAALSRRGGHGPETSLRAGGGQPSAHGPATDPPTGSSLGAGLLLPELRAVTLPVPSLVLSGGSTPRGLYRLLADPAAPYRSRLAWDSIHFFWGDERHVPPDHPDSNYRMAREAMLDRVPVPAAHVFRIAGEEPDAGRAAAAYEHELIATFGLRREERQVAASGAGAATGMSATSGAVVTGGATATSGANVTSAARAGLDWPRFDLVLLGLGDEGHTASLFPGSPLLAESRRLAAAVWVEKLGTWRITLTPPVLVRAAAVIFLVSGAAKAAALAAVVEGEPRPELYPAQVVVPVDGKLLWLVDEAAAARLRSGRRG